MQPGLKTEISVVVASHRRDYIGRCAEALLVAAQEAPGSEIIIVTDYDADTLPIEYPAIIWEFYADKSISRKRNCGIKKARGELVGFVDDDCLVKSDWIKTVAAFFHEHPGCAGVEGRTTIALPQKSAGHLREFKRLETKGFRTNNIFYKKEALERAGLFDERFTVQREDLDLAFTIMRMGGSIEYCESMEVSHVFRPNEPWDLLKNCINRRFDPLLYKKHPKQYREFVKRPVPPAIALVGLAWVLLVFDIALYQSFALAGAGILVIVAAFCALRRNQYRIPSTFSFLRDILAYLLAPFFLWSALVYGSIKWRRVLVW